MDQPETFTETPTSMPIRIIQTSEPTLEGTALGIHLHCDYCGKKLVAIDLVVTKQTEFDNVGGELPFQFRCCDCDRRVKRREPPTTWLKVRDFIAGLQQGIESVEPQLPEAAGNERAATTPDFEEPGNVMRADQPENGL